MISDYIIIVRLHHHTVYNIHIHIKCIIHDERWIRQWGTTEQCRRPSMTCSKSPRRFVLGIEGEPCSTGRWKGSIVCGDHLCSRRRQKHLKMLGRFWKNLGVMEARGQPTDFNLGSAVETGSHLVGCNGLNGFNRSHLCFKDFSKGH